MIVEKPKPVQRRLVVLNLNSRYFTLSKKGSAQMLKKMGGLFTEIQCLRHVYTFLN